MRSRIYADDSLSNANRKFGSALRYYVADLVPEDGVPASPVGLLFTEADIQQAMQRAADNPEDIGLARRKAMEEEQSYGWSRSLEALFTLAVGAIGGFLFALGIA